MCFKKFSDVSSAVSTHDARTLVSLHLLLLY